ncbi:MAG: redoxin domain-containing protein [Acidimicrobiales bacterium]|nr:redoxin domain-containing protein [Acidimicrobiales bacterium]
MRQRLHIRAAAALAVVVLVGAACSGGSDDDPAGGEGAATVPDTVEEPEPEEEPAAGETFDSVFAGAATLDGEEFDGGRLAGTKTVLWFWAPWCTSCRAEGPEVAEVAERHGDDVRVIGVPGRGQVNAMEQFVDDTGTGALEHVVDDDGSIWTAFGVYGQPAFAFIDDTGQIEVFVGTLGSALDDRVATLAGA